jgi:hypothetical protein
MGTLREICLLEGLRNLFSLSNNIMTVKPRRARWYEHVTRMKKMKIHKKMQSPATYKEDSTWDAGINSKKIS